MKSVTFPLSEEVFMILDTEDQSQYSVDVSKIDFGEDEDNIESSFVYMRNLQITMPLDFSNISYEEKSKWLLKYLTLGSFFINISILSETWLTILANDDMNIQCFFSDNEILKFRDENKELIDDIITFLVSLDDIIFLLLENKGNETLEYTVSENIETIKEKPSYFESITILLSKYPNYIDAIRLYYTESYIHKFYQSVIDSITTSNDLYQGILSLPSAKLIGSIYSFDIKDE